MNALIKKEIRLLLPAWITAMLLVVIILPLLQFFSLNNVPYNPDFLPIPFGLGILFLSLASFGQEFSHKTFSILLSQPIPRNRIWLVKIAVLATACASVLLTLFICYKIYFYLRPIYNIPFPIDVLTIYGLVIFSGGLWATLLLRQMTGAFWFAILVPAFLMLMLFEFSEHFHWSQHIDNYVITTIFLFYPIAGFLWAWKMFLRAQDTQWTGGEISFLWRRKISERAIVSSQPRHWCSALVRKEFQLHQANILIAALVFALHLASVVVRKVHPNFDNPNVKFILEQVWALWLLMPLLIGSAAVAEERRLGIIESQLCLPVSRRTQLFIKFSVALVLSLILGGLMPFVIEKTRDFNHWIFIVAAIIFFISFYASTLARTTLQAIGLAIVIAIGIYLYAFMAAVRIFRFGHNFTAEQFGMDLLKLFLGVPFLLATFGWLTFRNFKWWHENWKLWWRNSIVVLAAFAMIFILTNAIYFRVWELFMSNNVPHGAARLSISEPPKLLARGGAISTLLPDGRLWTEQTDEYPYGYGDLRIDSRTNTEHFIGGLNWVDATLNSYQVAAIQSDGSLWSIQSHRNWYDIPYYPLTQIGSGTNWIQVVAGGYKEGFLLLKKDGTLWSWGKYNRPVSSDKLTTYLATPSKRIGTETNWTEVFFDRARRRDGSVWEVSFDSNRTNPTPQFRQIPSQIAHDQLSFISRASVYPWDVGVKTNGELWLAEAENGQKLKKFQLGKNEKWKAVAFAGLNSTIALRSDGTLWQWNLKLNPSSRDQVQIGKPFQLGSHSDWVALHSIGYDNSVALAADGSLWVWNDPSRHVWLAPSRKPVFAGNIFQGANSKNE